MKLLSTFILLLLLLAIGHEAVAQSNAADSLIEQLRHKSILRSSFELGQLDVQAYTFGISHCQKQGLAGRLLPHLLPFQSNPSRDVAFEAFSHVHYQWPGDMHLNISGLESNNNRRARRVVHELYRALLPIYAARRHKDYGSNKSFVLPFYDDGPDRYEFQFLPLPDSLLNAVRKIGIDTDSSRLCCIGFEPTRQHHTLLNGFFLVDSVSSHILGLDCKGRIDMATFRSRILFGPDAQHDGLYIPHSSYVDIDYHYMHTRARNSYLTRFRYLTFTPYDSLQRDLIPLDLTSYYESRDNLDSPDFEQLRPFDLPHDIDSLLYSQGSILNARQSPKRKKLRIETVSETLVSGSRLGTDNNRLRIYGPLDPASLGYDKFNGFTIREQARWTYRFPNASELYMRAELGYAFKLREVRFRLFNEWTYLPRRRGRITFEAKRNNSNFSSKFINTVNEALQMKPGEVNFDSLGLDYYQRYEVKLEHSIELINGLMLHAGVMTTYRRPVKHGIQQATEQHREELIDSHYADFAPFVRLEWTPRQYYWYDEGYKTYIHSPAPTMAIELSKAVPGILGAQSDYGCAEFDMHQSINVSRTQVFAYRLGFGRFFKQRGEYFINYHYFSRSQYPNSWEDDRIGGTFHELNELWFGSSPSYLQAHAMYDTPFGLAHLIRPVSSYVIKERFYLSALWSEGKKFYNEVGYGIDNNYFNVGVFAGFKGWKYYGMGVKFRVEIGRHL